MKLRTNYLFIILGVLSLGSCKNEQVQVDCSDVMQNWHISNFKIPLKTWPGDLSFPSKEVGYVVSEDASVLKTEDSGESWRIVHSQESGNSIAKNNFTSVYFLDENNGFVGGENYLKTGDAYLPGAILLKTNDGGLTWTKKYFKDYFKFKDIRFANPNDGLAIVADWKCTWMMSLVSTNDGGNTWKSVVLPFKKLRENKLFEIGDYTGVICTNGDNVDYIYLSNNGGKSWETKALPGKYNYSVYFINDKLGFISGYRTTDGGNNWEPSTIPYGYSSIIHFKNENEGFIINDHEEWLNCSECDVPSLLYFESYETKDAGKSWVKTQIDKECGFYNNYIAKGGDALYRVNPNRPGDWQVSRFDEK